MSRKKVMNLAENSSEANDSPVQKNITYNLQGFNSQGYDKDGYDINGFDKKGRHRDTRRWYDESGHNKRGFNVRGIHKDTGTKYDPQGYDRYGYNEEKFNREGFSRSGLDRDGYNKKGFNSKGIHKTTQRKYNEQGYDINGFNSQGFNCITQSEYGPDGYNINGYNKDGFDRNGINMQGIREDTGKKDERVQFAEEFISYGKSIESFAKKQHMQLEKAKAIIEEARTLGCIKDKINETLNKNSNRFLGTARTRKEQLLSGKIGIKDISGIDTILKLCNDLEREKITEMLIKEMTSHNMRIMEYGFVLGIKDDSSGLPQAIMEKLKIITNIARKSGNKKVRASIKELCKEADRIKAYNAPYRACKGESIGYMENPTDKEPKMVEITDKHREMAKQYLNVTDEFICNKTMQAALLQIIKGDINQEKLDRAKKEKELRRLQKEDEELDEVIAMAEQVTENQQVNEESKKEVTSLE